jgi:hypothetical protein
MSSIISVFDSYLRAKGMWRFTKHSGNVAGDDPD